MNTIRWIFFDIGSTLVDEEEAYNHRIRKGLAVYMKPSCAAETPDHTVDSLSEMISILCEEQPAPRRAETAVSTAEN